MQFLVFLVLACSWHIICRNPELHVMQVWAFHCSFISLVYTKAAFIVKNSWHKLGISPARIARNSLPITCNRKSGHLDFVFPKFHPNPRSAFLVFSYCLGTFAELPVIHFPVIARHMPGPIYTSFISSTALAYCRSEFKVLG